MLTRWLTFTAFLAGSANPGGAAFTVAPTSRVKGHPEAELSLNCGDRRNAGVVQYWHTPFGDLQTPGFHSKLDPVYMHNDGSLMVPKVSILHSGLYYCLQQHAEGTTLWPYKLHVSHNTPNNQEHRKYEKCSSCDAFRYRRDVESDAERQEGISAGLFAGAMAASVLLTFVLGFSAGALSRTHVLRCFGAVTTGLRSQRGRQCQTDTLDHGPVVTGTTTVPRHDNQAFEMEQVWDDDSAKCATMNTTVLSPPPKPQRSFRIKQEEQENTAYLEGCDYKKEKERRIEEEVAGGRPDERSKGCHGETEEEKEFYLLDDGGSQTETDEDRCSDEGVEKDGRESREERMEQGQEKEVEEAHEQENRSKEGEGLRDSEAEARGNKNKKRDEKREEEEVSREETQGDDGVKQREEKGERDISSQDDETGSKNQEDTKKRGASSPREGRRSRVIRLYQYDDDGRRYCHLPDPAPDEPGPAPRLKQRSISLTRLNAIMAAASAGPLDTTETGKEERPHFQMEI